jgi:hypothetical protein
MQTSRHIPLSPRLSKSALANKDRYDILRGDTKAPAFSADMIVFYKTQIARTNEVREHAIVMTMELQPVHSAEPSQ